ncbi:hypothetical protein [Salinicola endophyticus]|uniref:Uncharacterized protein n=1 Tax=Salinicola endophyticus TaxID=1949083 RepID=A0AB74UHP1_9GAMM
MPAQANGCVTRYWNASSVESSPNPMLCLAFCVPGALPFILFGDLFSVSLILRQRPSRRAANSNIGRRVAAAGSLQGGLDITRSRPRGEGLQRKKAPRAKSRLNGSLNGAVTG